MINSIYNDLDIEDKSDIIYSCMSLKQESDDMMDLITETLDEGIDDYDDETIDELLNNILNENKKPNNNTKKIIQNQCAWQVPVSSGRRNSANSFAASPDQFLKSSIAIAYVQRLSHHHCRRSTTATIRT